MLSDPQYCRRSAASGPVQLILASYVRDDSDLSLSLAIIFVLRENITAVNAGGSGRSI